MQDEFVWLDAPFHKNKVSFDISEDDDLKDTLKISFDGSIMAVKKSCISRSRICYFEVFIQLTRISSRFKG